MSGELVGTCKSLSTAGPTASKRPFPCVGAQVCLEVGALAVLLTAAGGGALVGLEAVSALVLIRVLVVILVVHPLVDDELVAVLAPVGVGVLGHRLLLDARQVREDARHHVEGVAAVGPGGIHLLLRLRLRLLELLLLLLLQLHLLVRGQVQGRGRLGPGPRVAVGHGQEALGREVDLDVLIHGVDGRAMLDGETLTLTDSPLPGAGGWRLDARGAAGGGRSERESEYSFVWSRARHHGAGRLGRGRS